MLIPGTVWRLERSIDGHARCSGSALATQIAAGRTLRLLQDAEGSRWRVRLLEDGYPCWIEAGELQEHFLWRTTDEVAADLAAPGRRQAVVDELADVLICALLLADCLGVDIDAMIEWLSDLGGSSRKSPPSRRQDVRS